jgi:hypothetical protein
MMRRTLPKAAGRIQLRFAGVVVIEQVGEEYHSGERRPQTADGLAPSMSHASQE